MQVLKQNAQNTTIQHSQKPSIDFAPKKTTSTLSVSTKPKVKRPISNDRRSQQILLGLKPRVNELGTQHQRIKSVVLPQQNQTKIRKLKTTSPSVKKPGKFTG